MLLGTLESVVRADRATERRLLVSASGFGEWPRGADVGPALWDLECPLETTRREPFDEPGGVESEEERDTRDEVCGVARDSGKSSSGVDGELFEYSRGWRAENWGVGEVEIVGVPDLL